jgi:hypothetical protein
MTRRANFRIPGKEAVAGRVSHSCADPHSHECAYEPGQNGGFSDGFDGGIGEQSGRPTPATPPVLTKRCVDTCHSGQPGKSTDPKNPMKSKDDPPSKGFPPVSAIVWDCFNLGHFELSGSSWGKGRLPKVAVHRIEAAEESSFVVGTVQKLNNV